MIQSFEERLATKGRNDCVDVTPRVVQAVHRAKIRMGQATVFVGGSTAAITTIEYEPGVVRDLQAAIERLFPESLRYAHHETAGDDNGFSHIRAAFFGPSLTIPIVDGCLALGTWQQIVLLDFDTRPRERALVIQILGD